MRTLRSIRTLLVAVLVGTVAALAAVPALAAPRQTTPPSGESSTTSSTTAATTTTVATTTTAPGTKKKVLIVGDSVIKGIEVYGQIPTLQAGLPDYDITFDAEESRSTVAGAGVILSHNPAQFDTVVVSLGTNDAGSPQVFTERARRVLDELRAVPHVFWMTVHEKGRYAAEYTASNAALAKLAESYPNTKIIDWNAYADTLPAGELATDGLHLSQVAANKMATLIVESMKGTTTYSKSMATTTTVAPTTTAASTAAPTTEAASDGSDSSSNGLLIGIIVGAVIVVGFLAAAIAGWRRSKTRRREERKARLDELFGATPTSDDEPMPDDVATPDADAAVAGDTVSDDHDATGHDALPPLDLPAPPNAPAGWPADQATDGSGEAESPD